MRLSKTNKRHRGVSLEIKLLVICGIMLACPLIAATVTLHTLSRQASLTGRINLAGRQRMLTQRFAKEVLDDVGFRHKAAQDQPSWKRTQRLFEMTLAALHDGGTTYRDVAMTRPVLLEAEDDPTIRGKLETVGRIWAKLQQATDGLRRSVSGTPEFKQHLSSFRALNVECLKEMNNVVKMMESSTETAVASAIQYTAGAISLAMFGLVWLYIRRHVIKPIRAALALANAVASGDLTRSCKTTSSDEVGELSESLNNMCRHLREVVAEISDTTTSVHSSADRLSETSHLLGKGAQETASQSASAASAAEQMSANLAHMSDLTHRLTENIRNVSEAISEMTESVGGIARNAEHASAMADNAAELVGDSNRNIGQLGEAAQEIGKVVETIQDIAEQTNLLALNATIEAARAGESGKGFAVVATEVKELAKQTAEATEDIRRRISAIQASTAKAVESIGRISEVIGEVTEFSRSIASAVENQTVTTQQIADNIDEASRAAESLADSASETATAAQDITRSIASVDGAVQEVAGGASQTEESARQLSRLAERQTETLAYFQMQSGPNRPVIPRDDAGFDLERKVSVPTSSPGLGLSNAEPETAPSVALTT